MLIFFPDVHDAKVLNMKRFVKNEFRVTRAISNMPVYSPNCVLLRISSLR